MNLEFSLDQSNYSQQVQQTQHLSGDASNRSYFRIHLENQETRIIMQLHDPQDIAALRANRYPWIHLAKDLHRSGIRVPIVDEILPNQGLLILEDVGDTTLATHLKKTPESSILEEALHLLADLRDVHPKIEQHRPFDRSFFNKELNFLLSKIQKFFPTLLSQNDTKQFQIESEKLCDAILSFGHPPIFTHRDFHSRNIMLHKNELVLIDFQDARMGPMSYDLVSFIFDPYIGLNHSIQNTLLEKFEKILKKVSSPITSIEKTYPLVATQRLLKAIGSYLFLTCEKNKPFYFPYIKQASQSLLHLSQDLEDYPLLTRELPMLLKELSYASKNN